jgi:hypothetical protein
MPVALPQVRAASEHRTVTLGELRDLVDIAEQLPDDLIVRGMMIPFKVSDLGHPIGGCIMALGLDVPEAEKPPPPPPNRQQRRGRRGPRR